MDFDSLDVSGAMAGPFSFLGGQGYLNTRSAVEGLDDWLGLQSTPFDRAVFTLYSPRFSNDVGVDLPLHMALALGAPQTLRRVTVFDSMTNRAVLNDELTAKGVKVGAAACAAFGGAGCAFPHLVTLATRQLPAGLYYAVAETVERTLSQPLFFLLREAAGARPASARIALMHPEFTWQAYNYEGGASFYTPPPADMQFQVSLNRPIDQRSVNDYHNARAAIPFLRHLARLGQPVYQISNRDLRDSADFLAGVDLLIVHGHDEYWTAEIRANVDAFMARGGHVAIFSGNTGWWQTNQVGDTIYLNQGSRQASDPNFKDTGYFFQPWIKANIEKIFGLTYIQGGYAIRAYMTEEAASERGLTRQDLDAARGMTVSDERHPIFAGTGLAKGDSFGIESDLVFLEIDAVPLRADGKIDRTIWRSIPAATRPLASGLVYMASYPTLNGDPEGRFLVQGLIGELPGRRGRGTALHFGSIGWYRALAANDVHCQRIFDNTIDYLLNLKVAPGDGRPLRSGAAPAVDPSQVPPGAAEVSRRQMLIAGLAAAAAPALAVPAFGQTPAAPQPALLDGFAALRLRAEAGEPAALHELAVALLRESSAGAETYIEITVMLERALQAGHLEAGGVLYELSSMRLNSLTPHGPTMEARRVAAERLKSPHAIIFGAYSALKAADWDHLASYWPELSKLADKRDAAALTVMGLAMMEKASPRHDPAAAAATLEKAAAADSLIGQFFAARLRGESDPDDPAAVALMRQAAQRGFPAARYDDAIGVIRRRESEPRWSEACQTLAGLASSGHAQARLAITDILVTRARTLQDLTAVQRWLPDLVRLGYGNAIFLQGLMLLAGVGGPAQPGEGIKLLEKAALARHGTAERYMGLAYLTGKGVLADDVKAAQWFQLALESQDGPAGYNLALMRASGRGGPRDLAAARQAATRAAALGDRRSAAWLKNNWW